MEIDFIIGHVCAWNQERDSLQIKDQRNGRSYFFSSANFVVPGWSPEIGQQVVAAPNAKGVFQVASANSIAQAKGGAIGKYAN